MILSRWDQGHLALEGAPEEAGHLADHPDAGIQGGLRYLRVALQRLVHGFVGVGAAVGLADAHH
jgi:hypothetical protein